MLTKQDLNEFAVAVRGSGWSTAECAGLRFLGEGLDRVVYDLGDNTVIKVARGNTSQTKNEIRVWETASKRMRAKMCPILDYDEVNFLWTIMPKVVIGGIPHPIRERIGKLLHFSDWHDGNFGKLGRKIVAVDYGVSYYAR